MNEQRAVVSNSTGEVVAIGWDEGQGGQDYNGGEGTWCNFTFEDTPVIPQEVHEAAESSSYQGSLLVVENDSIRSKTVEEITR